MAPEPQSVEHQIQDDDVVFNWGGIKIAKLSLSPHIAVKFGPHVTLAEARSMKFVSEKTQSLPLPKVYGYYRYGPIDREVEDYGSLFDTYIFMDFVQGQTLAEVWDAYDEAIKSRVSSQLKSYLTELRSIEGGSYIGSVDRGPVLDPILERFERGGPFSAENEFNAAIIDAYQAENPKRHIRQYLTGMLGMFRHSIVFTHGDFVPRNIMVKDGNVTGIIDWELSGWYPEYWEYSRALFCWKWQNDWVDYLGSILRPYYAERAFHSFLSETLW